MKRGTEGIIKDAEFQDLVGKRASYIRTDHGRVVVRLLESGNPVAGSCGGKRIHRAGEIVNLREGDFQPTL